MASTNLQAFFNNPSTSREYTTLSSGLRKKPNAPDRLSDKDDTDNLRLERSKEVKQYKGKRDPSKPLASVRLQTTDSGGNMLRSYNGPNTTAASPDVIDLLFSNDSSTSSKSTICKEEFIASSQMSTSTDTSVSSAQRRLNLIENEKRKKLMEAALMAIDRDFPCMTTVDRVMNWKIADDLDEVEEFSSCAAEKLQPYTSYGKMYDTVKEHWPKDQKKTRRPLNPDIYSFRQKPASSVIKLRCEYGGKSAEKKTSETTTQNFFKVPDTPSKQLCSIKLPSADKVKQEISSTNNVAPDVLSADFSPESPTNHRDELFNYLQIDTNLSHTRTTQSDSSNFKRRSLRVKVQQSAASKSVKYNKEIEIEKKKVDELEQQVKKHLSMSMASGGAPCRFGIWGARKFHSKMNSIKSMNKTRSSTCVKQPAAFDESQTNSVFDEAINGVGSSNGVTTPHRTTTTRKKHKLFLAVKKESSDSLSHTVLQDLDGSMKNCQLNEVDGNSIPEPAGRSNGRKTRPTPRRHSENSMNVDLPEATSLKRRFSDYVIDPKQFMNVTVVLKNIDMTDADATIISKRLSSAQTSPSITAADDAPKSIAEIPPCLSPAPADTSIERVSSPAPDPPFIVIPESVCSSSAISPYPLTTSESERNIHSMSSTDVVVENLHETLQKTEHLIVANPPAITTSTTATNVSNLVKVTYVHKDQSFVQRSTQYKSVLPPRTCNTGSNHVSAPVSAGAVSMKPTCVLERINYNSSITPNVNKSNATYKVKILVPSKETASSSVSKPNSVTKEIVDQPCTPKIDNRKLVNSIFKKNRANGKNNRFRTASNAKMKMFPNPKVVTSTPSPTIKEKKPSAVVLDEQKIAINQLKALGDQYSEPVEKRKLSITAVQRFLKSRPLRSIRRNIRKASCRRISTTKGQLQRRPFGKLRNSLQHGIKSTLPSAIVYNSPTSTSTPQISTKSIATPLKRPKHYANDNVSSEAIDSTTAPGIQLPNSDSSSGGGPSTRSSDTLIIPLLQSSVTDFTMPRTLPVHQISAPKLSPKIKKNFNDSPVSSTTSRESADSAIGTSDQNICNMNVLAFGRSGLTTKATMERSHSMNSNPLNPSNGAVLAALYLGDTIIIVQESEVSFWKYPSRIYSIFGMVQNWELIGSAERQNSDIEVETPFQNRICSNEGRPAYVEFRAKQFPPTESRECYLASIYLNVYFFDDPTQEFVVHHVDLDRIMGNASSVRYTVLTESRYLVMSWTEQAVGNGTKCGLCKYSLSPDLDALASVRDFASLQHNIKSLTCFGDDKLLGFGYSVVTMWDHQTGDLLLNIDIDLPIGDNLGCFLSSENDDKYMFLVQHFNASGVAAQYLKLMAINLSDCFSWKVVQTHELPAIYESVTSSAITADSLTVTFKNGESLLLSLFNPRQIYMREPKTTIDTSTGIVHHQQSFVQNDKIFQISQHCMVIKAVYEHFLESDN